MEFILFAIAALSAGTWLYLLLMRGWFWRADQELSTRPAPLADPPDIVVVVRARNAADIIDDSLGSLLTQSYEGRYHVVVVDDRSTDDTADAAVRVAQEAGGAGRLSVIRAGAAPSDWSGEAWALSQGVEKALLLAPQARYLLLTDADFAHHRFNLQEFVAKAEEDGLDLLSLLPAWPCSHFVDRALAPTFAFLLQALHPLPWVNNPKRRAAAAHNGAILVNSEALVAAGGLKGVRREPAYGMALARRIKHLARARGRAIWLGIGEEVTTLRPGMRSLSVWRRMARHAMPAHGTPRAKRLAIALGMPLLFVIPAVVTIVTTFAGISLSGADFPAIILALVLGYGTWITMAFVAWPTFRLYDQPEWTTIFVPLSALFCLPLLAYTAFKERPEAGEQPDAPPPAGKRGRVRRWLARANRRPQLASRLGIRG